VTPGAGRFELRGLLGQGGGGAVHRGWDRQRGCEVAIKSLLQPYSPDDVQRFAREGQALVQLRHPHVVRAVACEPGPPPRLVMELLPHGSLEDRLRASGPLPVHEALQLGQVLAETLAFVHARGFLHRDLKPANVLLGEEGQPKLADFGLTRGAHAHTVTRTGEVLGTPDYLAPEQARAEEIDARTDVYGLGATLYAVLSGRPPVSGASALETLERVAAGTITPLRQLRPEVPAWLERVVLRCLATDPRDRYASAEEVAEVLRVPPAAGRSAWLAIGLLATAVLTVGTALTLWAAASPPRDDPRSEPEGAPNPAIRGAAPDGHPLRVLIDALPPQEPRPLLPDFPSLWRKHDLDQIQSLNPSSVYRDHLPPDSLRELANAKLRGDWSTIEREVLQANPGWERTWSAARRAANVFESLGLERWAQTVREPFLESSAECALEYARSVPTLEAFDAVLASHEAEIPRQRRLLYRLGWALTHQHPGEAARLGRELGDVEFTLAEDRARWTACRQQLLESGQAGFFTPPSEPELRTAAKATQDLALRRALLLSLSYPNTAEGRSWPMYLAACRDGLDLFPTDPNLLNNTAGLLLRLKDVKASAEVTLFNLRSLSLPPLQLASQVNLLVLAEVGNSRPGQTPFDLDASREEWLAWLEAGFAWVKEDRELDPRRLGILQNLCLKANRVAAWDELERFARFGRTAPHDRAFEFGAAEASAIASREGVDAARAHVTELPATLSRSIQLVGWIKTRDEGLTREPWWTPEPRLYFEQLGDRPNRWVQAYLAKLAWYHDDLARAEEHADRAVSGAVPEEQSRLQHFLLPVLGDLGPK